MKFFAPEGQPTEIFTETLESEVSPAEVLHGGMAFKGALAQAVKQKRNQIFGELADVRLWCFVVLSDRMVKMDKASLMIS